MNYAGLVCAAISFIRQSDEKRDVFNKTVLAHFFFYSNYMLLGYCKFRAYPYHLSLQLFNDMACSATCLPMYMLWAKNDFHNYFDKVDDGKTSPSRASSSRGKGQTSGSDGEITLIRAEDFNKDSSEKEGDVTSKRDIEQLLSDIELKRA